MSKKILIEKFKSELIKVNGDCFVFKNLSEALKELKSIIAKEKIKNIAISTKTDIAKSIFDELKKDSSVTIESVEELNKTNSILKDNLKNIDLGISCADFLVAETGSVILKSSTDEPRLLSLLPESHIVISTSEQIIERLEDAVDFLSIENWVTVITGPSRTADIEKVLVTGVHGPKKLYVFINDIEIS
ncbi:MAG: hypothetical protein IGBAC_1636 [Ignavibacteriae bacterium]|nr:MAG: hypothetical protein IGBAC_1636 [Ignavibacteriota bacterium]